MMLPAEKEDPKAGHVETSVNGWCLTLTRADGTRLEICPPEFNDSRMQALVQGFLGG
jgi:hypothetical protein